MSILITSGNLQQLGDSGQYESIGEIAPGVPYPTIAGSNWGAFNNDFNRSRDTTLFKAGIASCKLTEIGGGVPSPTTFTEYPSFSGNWFYDVVFGQCTIEPNKKYIITAWVRTPSANPIAQDACKFSLFFTNLGLSIEAHTDVTIAAAKDVWQQISLQIDTADLPSSQPLNVLVAIIPNNHLADFPIYLGVVNIDQFEIYEYQDVVSIPLAFDLPSCIVTDDSGASDGAITVVATGGTAPYQCSINGGAYGGSNVFIGLAVSAIPYVVNIKDSLGAIVSQGFTVNLSGSLNEQYNTTPICIITLDQDYPTYDMKSGDKIYCYCAPDNYTIVVQRYSNGSFYTINQGPTIQNIQSNLIENVYPFDASAGPKGTLPGRHTVGNWKSFLQFCDINNPGRLIFFTGNYNLPIFPYAQSGLQNNSPSCTAIVCDLFWLNDANNPKITAPTNQYSMDGQIKVTAQSSYAPIRYSLNEDKDYSLMSNTSGIFSGLAPGTYTVFARDTHNCKNSLRAVVTLFPTYSPKFRLESSDQVNSVAARVDICERDYAGSVIDIDGGESPIVLSKPQTDLQNKFEALRPTFATLTLASKKNYQFISLFSQDDRKYLVKYYKPLGTLKWSGFVVPSVFSEEMALPTYFTQVKVVDNIEELSAIPFLDGVAYQGNAALLQYIGGNLFTGNFSLVQIVCMCLYKLNLNINVRFAINIIEQSYGINPTEAYIDAATFYDYSNNQVWNCDKVLKTVLEPFGAFVIQDDGVWNVVRLEEQCAPYDYKEYDYTGAFVGTGTNDKVIEIKDPSLRMGAAFTDIDQSTLEINPAYGIIDLQHQLIAKPSLLFDFDFNPLNFDGTNFKGWTIDRNHQNNVKVTCEEIVEDNVADQINTALGINKFSVSFGSFALTLQNLDNPTDPTSDPAVTGASGLEGGQYILIHSQPKPIEYTTDGFEFSYDYRFNLADVIANSLEAISGIRSGLIPSDPAFIKMKFRIKLGSGKYFDISNQLWLTSEKWNDVDVDKFDSDQNFKTTISFPNSTTLVNDTIQISFQINGASKVDVFNTTQSTGVSDFPFVATLKTLPTITLPLETKIKVLGSIDLGASGVDRNGHHIVNENYFYYTLKASTDGDSGDQIVRPNDYNGGGGPGGNAVTWVLDSSQNTIKTNLVYKFYLDNVLIKFKPLFSNVPTLEDIGLINNQNYKENLQIELNAGDLPEAQIDSAKYIYYNYFRTSAGQPTGKWNRNGINETNTIQKILLKQLAKQYSNPTYKISGDLRGYNDLGFLTIIKHTQEAPEIDLVNPELNGDVATNPGWQNYGAGTQSWANNSDQAYVSLGNGDSLSQIYAQVIPLEINVGERLAIDLKCICNITTGLRVDELHVCLLDVDANIVQDVTVKAFANSDTIIKRVSFNVQQDAVNIGFYVKRIPGPADGPPSTSNFAIDYFRLTPLSVVRFYAFNTLDIDHRKNNYTSELLQIIPMLSGSDPAVDDGGNNSGNPGGGSGGFSGAYSSGFGSGFNSVLS